MIIRKPNLENLTKEGIPKDFADVRDYFNESLKNGSSPWTPRKTPITSEEIKNLWVPSSKVNISIVAEEGGKVIGLSTVLYDPMSNNYEHAKQRMMGELNSTTNSNYDSIEVTKKLLEGIIKELKTTNNSAHCYLPIESPNNDLFQEIGYVGKETSLEFYKANNLSGKVFQYQLP